MPHRMTSIELEDATAAALRSEAQRQALTVDAYVRRLQVQDSVRQHAAAMTLDDAEAAALEAESVHAEIA